jgi:hypothetical protein
MRQSLPRPRGPERRISARYLVIIYNDVPPRLDYSEIKQLLTREEARCTVTAERHKDGSTTGFAFVDFAGKRFQKRNKSIFDVQGHHPEWLPIIA